MKKLLLLGIVLIIMSRFVTAIIGGPQTDLPTEDTVDYLQGIPVHVLPNNTYPVRFKNVTLDSGLTNAGYVFLYNGSATDCDSSTLLQKIAFGGTTFAEFNDDNGSNVIPPDGYVCLAFATAKGTTYTRHYVTGGSYYPYNDGITSVDSYASDYNWDTNWDFATHYIINVFKYEFELVIPPPNSPTVSDLILTSAEGSTNSTYTDTPTINYTLSIAGVACMSNDSTGDYTDCISRGGLCSVAELDTKGVCTLQEIEKLTNYNVAQPLYFFANSSDDVYSLNYNNTIGVTLLPTYELSGNVKDSDGNLIEGALVTAELNNSPVILYNTTSDSIGEWTITKMSNVGTYVVKAYSPINGTLDGDCKPGIVVS